MSFFELSKQEIYTTDQQPKQVDQATESVVLKNFLGGNLNQRWSQHLHKYKSQREKKIRLLLQDFKETNIQKIVGQSNESLKRIGNTWSAFQTGFVLSSPDFLRYIQLNQRSWRLRRWCITTEARCPGRVCIEFKKFCTYIRWLAFDSKSPKPDLPEKFPGFPLQEGEIIPRLWLNLLPWLWRVSNQSRRIGGTLTKMDFTRIAHFFNARGFPGPTKERRREAKRELFEILTQEPTPNIPREEILYKISQHIGRFIHKRLKGNLPTAAHTSLTNSASFFTPIKEGGRAMDVSIKLKEYLTRIPEEDVDGVTYFNYPYNLRKGIPVWKTLCREVFEGDEAEGGETKDTGAYLDIPMMIKESPISKGQTEYFYEDPIYGLDERLGYQIMQWAYEELIDRCVISAPRYFKTFEDAQDLKFARIGDPNIRISVIGEPGWKERVITITEDFVTIFLQPLAHDLGNLISKHPVARSGFRRGWQLWEYVKELRLHPDFPGEVYHLTSDLKSATDFCRFDFSHKMLEGFVSGLGRTSPYYSMAIDLLCSSFTINETDDTGVFFDQLPTKRGILMGNPGTKIVLTLHNICAEIEASIRWFYKIDHSNDMKLLDILNKEGLNCLKQMPWRHFVCAGDDHFAQGPISYLQLISLTHEANGMTVSKPKTFISKIGGAYCEELYVRGDRSSDDIRTNVPLFEQEYEKHPHIDAMKPRLFSTCAKECDVKDETNHAVGKAGTASGTIMWLGGEMAPYRKIFSRYWETIHNSFLPRNKAFRYLPIFLGGVGCPALHKEGEWEEIYNDMSPLHVRAIIHYHERKASTILRRILTTFSSNTLARGVKMDFVEEYVRCMLKNEFLVEQVTIDDLKPEHVDNVTWANMKYWEKTRAAEDKDYIYIGDAIQRLLRVYLFRDLLFPEMSIKHNCYKGIQIKSKKTRSWTQREQTFHSSVSEELSEKDSSSTLEEFEEIKALLINLTSGKNIREMKEIAVIPKKVVEHSTFCSLSLPYLFSR